MSLQKPNIPETGDNVISINLSAQPQITSVIDGAPASTNYPYTYISKGVSNYKSAMFIKKVLVDTKNPQIVIEGQSMQYTTAVYVSTTDGMFTSAITGLTDNDLFAGSNLSALYPAFSGYNINNLSAFSTPVDRKHGFKIVNDYMLEITLPKVENTGYMDIIVVNPAGYDTLMNSLTTTIRVYQ
ncbi:hypothetical protein H8E06_00910 [bacterium]|nr:hypothetical protein [bacterium]